MAHSVHPVACSASLCYHHHTSNVMGIWDSTEVVFHQGLYIICDKNLMIVELVAPNILFSILYSREIWIDRENPGD